MNQEKATVHTFGIGNGVSQDLVRNAAKAGNGTCTFVSEMGTLKAKVIVALDCAT